MRCRTMFKMSPCVARLSGQFYLRLSSCCHLSSSTSSVLRTRLKSSSTDQLLQRTQTDAPRFCNLERTKEAIVIMLLHTLHYPHRRVGPPPASPNTTFGVRFRCESRRATNTYCVIAQQLYAPVLSEFAGATPIALLHKDFRNLLGTHTGFGPLAFIFVRTFTQRLV